MPKVYISPSNQYFNTYYGGNGNEGQYMNSIADIAVPYFLLNGVESARRDKSSTVTEAIADSNRYRPDLHIAIHSNASPDSSKGENEGPEIYYFRNSEKGKAAAQSIAEQMREIYKNPDAVKVIPATNELAELNRTVSPSVYVEVGYHDNEDDARWIKDNTDAIARAIVRGTLNYFEANE